VAIGVVVVLSMPMLRVINTAWLVSSQREADIKLGIVAVGLTSTPTLPTTFVTTEFGSPAAAALANRLRFWPDRVMTIVRGAPFSTIRDIISAATTLISPRIAAPTANVFPAEPRPSKKKCFNFSIGLSLSSNTHRLRENG
jgi:hypothetical protein